jgi:hypothetical protein
MTSRRNAPENAPRGRERSEERARLAAAFRGAGADLEDAATLVGQCDDPALLVDGLDDARTVLFARLYRHSNDFSATTALKALDTFSAGVRADAPSSAPERLRRQGQPGTEAARRWLHLGGAA